MSFLRGSYDVVINSRRLQYKFTIRRNVTIIRGQSATGKTTLVEMIRDCNENGIDSGITISCDKEYSERKLAGYAGEALCLY